MAEGGFIGHDLLQAWLPRMTSVAKAAHTKSLREYPGDKDEAIGSAIDAVENLLFSAPEFDGVAAASISDVAYDLSWALFKR